MGVPTGNTESSPQIVQTISKGDNLSDGKDNPETDYACEKLLVQSCGSCCIEILPPDKMIYVMMVKMSAKLND